MDNSTSQTSAPPLLEVRNLTKHFPVSVGLFRRQVGVIKAVDDVSFDVHAGETLGLVGESGSGKTTAGRLILRLLEPTNGKMIFHQDGQEVDLLGLQREPLRRFRRHMQLIFQDPFASLNPRMMVSTIISEPLRAQGVPSSEIEKRVRQLTDEVKLNYDYLKRYPHAFSGGQRQRIGIARALALHPKLVICDEPVSALDVSVQAQIINLLKDLQQEHGLAYLFIAHDLSVVENLSHRVAVMYAGRIVEMAETNLLFRQPRHPYTKALMEAVPDPVPRGKAQRNLLEGEVADPSDLPSGCSFHPRCRFCEQRCREQTPELRDLGGNQLVACHLAEDIASAGN